MPSIKRISVIALAMVIATVTGVNAGLLTQTGNGAAVQGSADYNFTDGSNSLSGSVEYAVFDRGEDVGSYSGLFADVADEGRYVYVYQIFNGGTESVDYFSIGLEGASVYYAGSQGTDDAWVASAASYEINGSQSFIFSETLGTPDGFINSGDISEYLIIVSDNGWVKTGIGAGSGSGSGSGTGTDDTLARIGGGVFSSDVTVPEPATIALFGLAGLMLRRKRA